MKQRTRIAITLAVMGAIVIGLVSWVRNGRSSDAERSPDDIQKTARTAATGRSPSFRGGEQRAAFRVEGQVVDASYAPAAGAIVALLGAPPQFATSGDDGSFAFMVSRFGPYSLRARTDGKVATAEVTLSPSSDPAILILRDATAVRIQVSDAKDAPIAGAAVQLQLQSATTDARGEARISGLDRGPSTVRVSAPGFASVSIDVFVPAARKDLPPLRVALASAVPIAGIALSPNRQPVAAATVTLQGTKSNPLSEAVPPSALTDADGRWRFDDLPAGSFQFVASHPRFAPSNAVSVKTDAHAGREGVELILESGHRITGTVTRASGDAVADAEVQVEVINQGMLAAFKRTARSDNSGRFEFEGLPAAAMRIAARGDDGAHSQPREIDVSSAAPEALTLILGDVFSISGVVIDETDTPVARASVMVQFNDALEDADVPIPNDGFTTADEGGRFRLTVLQDTLYRLTADHPGSRRMENIFIQRGVTAHAGDENVRVPLPRSGRFIGRLTFNDGNPVPRYSVRLGTSIPQAVAASDGSFSIDDVPAGTSWLTFAGAGFEKHILRDVALASGETKDLGVIQVLNGRTIRGRVVTTAGAPVAGAVVVLGPNLIASATSVDAPSMPMVQPGRKVTSSGSNGEFSFSGLGEAAQLLIAGHERHGRSAPVHIEAGPKDSTHVLRLSATGSLHGTFTQLGEAVVGANVVAAKPSAPNLRFLATTDENGRFAYSQLEPGDYIITGYNDYQSLEPICGFQRLAKVEVGDNRFGLEAPKTSSELTVKLNAAATAQIYLSSKKPKRSATLGVLEPALQAMADATVCSGIASDAVPFSVRGIAPGTYTICAAAIPINRRDPNNALKIAEALANLPTHCEQVDVSAGQTVAEVHLPADK